MKKIILLTSIILTTLAFTGCGKKNKTESFFQSNMELNVQETNETYVAEKTRLHSDSYSGKTIVVFFGYGFNSQEFYKSTVEVLNKNFGLKENGGLIQPVLYPQDLHGRIMNLYDAVSPLELSGIILLGAPERTHLAVAKLQDDWNSKEPYSVFSFFPQDDIAGQEANCSFVLEYEQTTSEEVEETEIEQTLDENLLSMLNNSIKFMTELPGPLNQDKDLIHHVRSIAGNSKVRHYIDNETGIQVRNHFILEKEF